MTRHTVRVSRAGCVMFNHRYYTACADRRVDTDGCISCKGNPSDRETDRQTDRHARTQLITINTPVGRELFAYALSDVTAKLTKLTPCSVSLSQSPCLSVCLCVCVCVSLPNDDRLSSTSSSSTAPPLIQYSCSQPLLAVIAAPKVQRIVHLTHRISSHLTSFHPNECVVIGRSHGYL